MGKSIEELKKFVSEREDNSNFEGKTKRDYDRALEYAWISIDNASYGLWSEAARFACLAVKTERLYDLKSSKWRNLPKMIIEHMDAKLWPM